MRQPIKKQRDAAYSLLARALLGKTRPDLITDDQLWAAVAIVGNDHRVKRTASERRIQSIVGAAYSVALALELMENDPSSALEGSILQVGLPPYTAEPNA